MEPLLGTICLIYGTIPLFLKMFYLYREDIEDDLSELTSEAVPDEVRKWLASTFAKQEQVECVCNI